MGLSWGAEEQGVEPHLRFPPMILVVIVLVPFGAWALDDVCLENLRRSRAEQPSFYSFPVKSVEETAALNAKVLDELRVPFTVVPLAGRKAALNLVEREKLFQETLAIKPVKESLGGAYNGSNNDIGFCFGRAMAFHLQALRSGLRKEGIQKLWVVGDLKRGEVAWSYHVTTIVMGVDGVWYAMDPFFGRQMPAHEWVAIMRNEFDAKGTMRLFKTEAARFSPVNGATYSRHELAESYYYEFFRDLLNVLHRENTGRPGGWPGVQNARVAALRAKLLNERLKTIGTRVAIGAGVTVIAAVTYKVFERYLDRESSKGSPPPVPLDPESSGRH